MSIDNLLNQEIVKVKEWVPHISPVTKVIPIKLFLDMEPGFSVYVARTMRKQPSRFHETSWDDMASLCMFLNFVP